VEKLPDHYFRIRENGAQVFRLSTDDRSQRIEMEPIAVVNARSGEIRPQGERELTDADRAAIAGWLASRQETLARREDELPREALEQLNLTAQWAQSRATDEDLEAITDALLLAMHDLRTVLVRKKADRMK
jgi:hypothetical protein